MRLILPIVALLPLIALSGCGEVAGPPPATAARRAPPALTAPTLQVIGSEARTLIAQFGAPALDQREGPARKLQFRGPACVLDAYVYPSANGGPPRVTWIDTRGPQGNDMDRASCVAALSRR